MLYRFLLEDFLNMDKTLIQYFIVLIMIIQ